MSVHCTTCTSDQDLQDLFRFLAAERRAHGPGGFLHRGDVIWRGFTPTPSLAVDLSETLALWRKDGALLAAAFCWPPDDTAEIMVSQSDYDPDIERDAFAFAVDLFRRKERPQVMTGCCEGRQRRAETLASLGFTRGPERMNMEQRIVLGGAALPPSEPPEGYVIADMTNLPVPLEKFLAGRPHDPMRYRAMMARNEYRAELDVSMFRGDERAGFCIGWFDPLSRSGLLEPVGVSEADRGRGVGTCLIAEVMHRLFALGAERIHVLPFPWNEPAIRLYHKVGFRRVALDEAWTLTF